MIDSLSCERLTTSQFDARHLQQSKPAADAQFPKTGQTNLQENTILKNEKLMTDSTDDSLALRCQYLFNVGVVASNRCSPRPDVKLTPMLLHPGLRAYPPFMFHHTAL